MARIAGVDLPRKKRIEVGLTYIYGIGASRASHILKAVKINPDIRVQDLKEEDANKIRDYLRDNAIKLEGDLRREVGLNIKRLEDINCYKGRRHRLGLPVRGQNTRTNAKTRKNSKIRRMKKK